VIWAFGIVLKHLSWYITTSEMIPRDQQGKMIESLETILRLLQKAEREERRRFTDPLLQDTTWKDDVNEIRGRLGKRPVGERRLVDELIEVILNR